METYSRITRFCLVCNYVTRSVCPLLPSLDCIPCPCRSVRTLRLIDYGEYGYRFYGIETAAEFRIIEPLASRCSKFRFRPLAQVSSQARIEMIAEAEGVNADAGVSPSVPPSLLSWNQCYIKACPDGNEMGLSQDYTLMTGLTTNTGFGKWGSTKSYNIPPNSSTFAWSY
jgi:hypothetical protein